MANKFLNKYFPRRKCLSCEFEFSFVKSVFFSGGGTRCPQCNTPLVTAERSKTTIFLGILLNILCYGIILFTMMKASMDFDNYTWLYILLSGIAFMALISFQLRTEKIILFDPDDARMESMRRNHYENCLAEAYSQKSDAQLLDLHTKGSLVSAAYLVLEKELIKRKAQVPPRPGVKILTKSFFSAFLLCTVVFGIYQYTIMLDKGIEPDIYTVLYVIWKAVLLYPVTMLFLPVFWAVYRAIDVSLFHRIDPKEIF